MSYNGFKNYETWAVKLHIDNQEAQSRYWADEARRCYRAAAADGSFSRSENAQFALADRLKSEHESAADDLLTGSPYEVGPLADLLRGALSDVDYREIAESLLDGFDNEEDE